MQPWHLTLASRGRNTLFPEPDALTRAVRALARVAGPRLLLFAIVDDHVHLVLHCDRAEAATLAGGVSRSLAAVGAPPLAPVFVRAVDGRRHLETLLGYCVRQPAKHGIGAHPALYAGSCAPDLLGLRLLPGFDCERIARALPRADILALAASAAGVPAYALRSPAPITDPWSIAGAAGALLPNEGSRHALRFRVACASLGGRGELPLRTFERYRAQAPDPVVCEVLRRRLAVAQAFGFPNPAAARALT